MYQGITCVSDGDGEKLGPSDQSYPFLGQTCISIYPRVQDRDFLQWLEGDEYTWRLPVLQSTLSTVVKN